MEKFYNKKENENKIDEEILARLLSQIVVTVDYLNLDQIFHEFLKSE